MSSSDGNPPAVTSDANVNVQYVSLLLVGAMVKTQAVDTTTQCTNYENR